MKRLCALGVSLLALALAGNAAANDGSGSGNQTAVGSVGTVQVASVNASPSTAVNAPVNANAPVSVAGETGDSIAQQESGGASASSTSSGSSETRSQGSCECQGQNGRTSPAQKSGGNTAQTDGTGNTTRTSHTEAHPASSCCDDKTSSSCECNDKSRDNIVWGDAPVRVPSNRGSATAQHENGGAQASAATECRKATGRQSAVHSIGTVQDGSVAVAPATAVNGPIDVNAPVAVLSGGGDESAAQKSGGATAVAGPVV